MQLTPEARLANEILLNAFRTLKFSGFTPDTQKIIMDCVGKALTQCSRIDQNIDDRIQGIEYMLYRSQFPEFYEHFQL